MPRLSALRLLLVLAATAAADAAIAPGQEGQITVAGNGHPCVLHVPSDWQPGKRLPLILFMHGSGGSPTTWPFKDATGGAGYLVCGLSYGAFADAGAGGIKSDPASCAAMVAFIDQVRAQIDKDYGVDQKRVFITGLSMGGWGVDFYGLTKAAKGRYRGYAIIAAGAQSQGNDLGVARGLPVLVLNGANDPNLATANAGMPLLEAAGAQATQVVLPGEGHVPAIGVMAPKLKEWLEGIERADARDAAIAAVTWSDGALAGEPAKGEDGLQAWITGQAFVAAAPADKPILVYCVSSLATPDGQPAPPARECAAVEEAAFAYPGAAAVPAAARHFACVRVDCAAIDPKASKLLNAMSAPQVLLIPRDRSSAVVLKGKGKLTDAGLSAEMRKLLDAETISAIDQRIADTAGTRKDMLTAQKKLRAHQDALAKLRDTPAKDDAARKARGERIAREDQVLKDIAIEMEKMRDLLAAQ